MSGLHHLQLVRSVVKQGVEGVALTPHAHVVVEGGELLGDHPVGEHALPLSHNHNIHNNILGETDGGPEVASKGDEEVEDGDDVLGVHRLDTPACLVALQAQHTVGHSENNAVRNRLLSIIISMTCNVNCLVNNDF